MNTTRRCIYLALVASIFAGMTNPVSSATRLFPDGSCDPLVTHKHGGGVDRWGITCYESCHGNPSCDTVETTDHDGVAGVTCASCNPDNGEPDSCCHAVLILGPVSSASWAGNCGGDCDEGSCHLEEGGSPTMDTWDATCGAL